MFPICEICRKESQVFAESETMVWLECPKCKRELCVAAKSEFLPKKD